MSFSIPVCKRSNLHTRRNTPSWLALKQLTPRHRLENESVSRQLIRLASVDTRREHECAAGPGRFSDIPNRIQRHGSKTLPNGCTADFTVVVLCGITAMPRKSGHGHLRQGFDEIGRASCRERVEVCGEG